MHTSSITALLPVKNGEFYLESLSFAILNMLLPDDELLIVNDGSGDRTGEILSDLAGIDSRITILESAGLGLVHALNLGLDKARNPWIARFDIDDIYSPDRLAIQRELISEKVVAIFSDYGFISHSGKALGSIPSAITPGATRLSLVSSQRTAHPSSMFNVAIAREVGGYSPQDFPAEDLGLWLRLSARGDLISVPQQLLKYRLTSGSVSRSKRKEQKEKARELINLSSSWNEVYELEKQNLDRTIRIYSQQTFGFARVFLLMRELKIVGSMLKSPFTFKEMVDFCGPILTIKVLISGFNLALQTVIRRLYRTIF